VGFLMLKIINMKAKTDEFYYIEELKTYVKLSSIESFKLEKPIKTMNDSFLQCCIITNKSIYWCNRNVYSELQTILIK
jgi:hypothetical protein